MRKFQTRLMVSLLALIVGCQSASALVKVDTESIELALKYGMQNQAMGYSNLLGPNWMEGPDGILLNIYSPFMMLATKAAKGGFPENPTQADIKKAKTKYAKTIRDLTDPHLPLRVKFSVALYGDDPAFAGGYKAWIEGFGRGKEFRLEPKRDIRQKVATKVGGESERPYDAINAYYFDFKDLELLDEYRFVLQGPTGEPVVFRINNKNIY